MGSVDIKQPSKKGPIGFQGSIAMRVLLVSFVFIVVPLIFYSYFIYEREYRGRLRDVFAGLNILEADHLQFLKQLERFELDYLHSMRDLIRLREQTDGEFNDAELSPVFLEFAQNENITALFYLKILENGDIHCTHSTLPEYLDQKFNDYVDLHRLLQEYDRVYVGPDPLFGYSFVVFSLVYQPGGQELQGILCISVALDQLLEQLSWFRTNYPTEISILNHEKKILASTDKVFVGKTPQIEDLQPTYDGYAVDIGEKKQYAMLAFIPNTSQYLMITIPASELVKEFNLYLLRLSVFLLFILVVGTLTSFLLSLRMTRPLKQLRQVMDSVGHGNLQKEYVHDSMGFEINLLGDCFNQMRIDLDKYIEEAKKEKAGREAYEKELQIAHEIQESILPVRQASFPGVEMSIHFSPAKEVAGDYYDWFISEEAHEMQLVIADGSGKGTMACLYAFDLRSLIRAYTEQRKPLSEVVKAANRMFCIDTKETGSFVTVFISRYNNETKELEYVNCGHNPPFLKRANGDIERLVTQGIALGVDENAPVETKKTTLQTGDVIFFYTDGVTDAQNMHKELFSEERLVQFIRSRGEDTSKAWLSAIIAETTAFSKGQEQYDDMTLIVFRIL